MRSNLEAIRGVAGVWGVILWSKADASFEKILPARLADEESEQLCRLVSDYSRRNVGVKEAIVKLAEGWAIIYDRPSFTLLMLARSDLNRATLKLVLKSALASLQSTLGNNSLQAVSAGKFSTDHMLLLIRTINLCLSFFQSKLPKFEIASMLRQAKDELLPDHPVLKNLTVDANGGIIPIRGAEKRVDFTLVAASARLIGAFLNLVSTQTSMVGFDIEKLTLEQATTLNELGFYNFFQQHFVKQ